MVRSWLTKKRTLGPGSADSFIVFMLALAWATFSGPLLRSAFGMWSVAAFTVGLSAIPVVVVILCGFSVCSTFRLKRPRPGAVCGGIILSSGMLVAVIVLSIAVSVLFPLLPVSGKTFRTNVNDPDLFRLLISVVFLPAIGEEFLFRGFILSGIDQNARRVSSAVLCGVLFGLLHLEPLQIPFTAAVGIGLSWVALETGSIFIPILMHAFHNFMMLFIARYGLSEITRIMNAGRESAISLVAFFALGIAAAVFLIVFGIRIVRKDNSSVRLAVSP